MTDAGIPGLVEVLDVIELDDRPGMVMPRYPTHLGEWLQQVIHNPTASTLDDILRIIAELATTLAGVHEVQVDEHRIVHRDVKPENVFLDADGHTRLGDFGGAMRIDGLRQVELALFGTPMWAPLDQILPGQTIPDPTWDTYAACVLLYAAVTGARPAYQADPRELLTERGRELWALARQAIEATGEPRRTLRRDFAKKRVGSNARDLVDFTGRAALNDADRDALDSGIARLTTLAEVPEDRKKALSRGLWNILVRGLSPLSHPSPPNRYRNGVELAEAVDDLRELLARPETTAHNIAPDAHLSGPMPGPDVPIHSDAGERRATTTLQETALQIWGPAVAVGLAAVVGLAILWKGVQLFLPAPMVDVPAGEVSVTGDVIPIAAFQVDRTEVTASSWQRCLATGDCSAPTRTASAPSLPAVGVTFADAAAYCEFRGGRLPTLAEYLYLHGDHPWPWGSELPTCDHAIALGCGDDVQVPGSAPDGNSRHGLVDLAGNAWEWVVQPDGSGLLIGGGAKSPASQVGRGGRLVPPEGAPWPMAGLRCAYDF